MQPQRPKRRLLRYHNLPLPADYIYIHSALNQIGKKRYPESWGIGPAWDQRAFKVVRLRSGKKRVVTYELDRPNKQFKRMSRAVIPEGDVEKCSASPKLFVVMHSLLVAITSGAVKTYHMTIGDKPARIPPNSMHWVKRRMEVLHTGYVLADGGDGQLAFREVLLSKSDFERWLSKDGLEKDGPKRVSSSKFTVLSDDLVKALCDELCRVSEQHGNLPFSEEPLWQLVKKALLPDKIQRATFERNIFSQLPESARQTVGRGFKRNRDTFTKIKDQIVLDLKQTVERERNTRVDE